MDHHGNTTEVVNIATGSIRQMLYSCHKFYPDAPDTSQCFNKLRLDRSTKMLSFQMQRDLSMMITFLPVVWIMETFFFSHIIKIPLQQQFQRI